MMNKKKLSNELNKVALEIERTYLISKEDETKEGATFSSYPSAYRYSNEDEEDKPEKDLKEEYEKLREKMKGEKEETENESKDEDEEDLASKTEKVKKEIETLEKRVGKTAKDDSDIMTIATELRNMADKLEEGYRTMLQGSRFN